MNWFEKRKIDYRAFTNYDYISIRSYKIQKT